MRPLSDTVALPPERITGRLARPVKVLPEGSVNLDFIPCRRSAHRGPQRPARLAVRTLSVKTICRTELEAVP